MSAHPKIKNLSGQLHWFYRLDKSTLYASPYLVTSKKGYTKHYYAWAERVASQMGRGKFSDVNTSIADNTATAAKKQTVLAPIRNRQQITSSNVQFFAYLSSLTNRLNDTSECYFYHPDHLGSSSWITDSAGTAVQHLHYLPFGETFVSQRSADFDAMYTFSAKEKDAETGYSYFGARYYSSDLSIWLSVDPQASKYPSLSPYVYCANNPIKLVDPNGEEIDWVMDKNGRIYWDDNAINQETTKQGDIYLGKEGQRSIGTDVWNYNSDGTTDELRPVSISMNKELPSSSENDVIKGRDRIEKIDNVISTASLTTALPVAAAAESVAKKTSRIALKSFGSIFSIASVAPDVVRYVQNPTVENRNRMIVSGIGSAISLVPVVGPVGSVIWNSIDMGGGFDKFYK